MATHPPTPPAAAPPQGPTYPAPSPRRNPAGVWIAAALALVVSIAALILGAIALSKSPQQGDSTPAAATTATPARATPILFDDDADRTLCMAITDLMHERNVADKAFQALPPAGSPERAAADPDYKAGVEDWARRIQTTLADHAQPDRYLTRTLQRYIDDKLLYAQNIYPGKPADPFDEDTWNLGVVDYGGALGRCQQLDIHW